MLDFYAVEDMHPWPDDMPAARRLIGSMSSEDFHSSDGLVSQCLRACGCDRSHFDDWIIPREEIAPLLRCLRETAARLPHPVNPNSGLGMLMSIIARAEGSILLAVCD